MESLKGIPKPIRKSITRGPYPGIGADWFLYGWRARKCLLAYANDLSLDQGRALANYAVAQLRKATSLLAFSAYWFVYVLIWKWLESNQISLDLFDWATFLWVAGSVVTAFYGWKLSFKPLWGFVGGKLVREWETP